MYRPQMGIALAQRDRAAGGAGAPMPEPAPPETPITPGELEIRSYVTVTIAIK
jgi:hypothetical protein